MQADPRLFGHDPLPGIVSVYANLAGQAWVWRREGEQVHCEQARFCSWVFARDLEDAQGLPLSWDDPAAPFHVQERRGPPGSLKYLLTATDGQELRRRLLAGASRRLKQPVTSFHDLDG